MEKISFIISNYNTVNYTAFCYNSIRENLGYEHEVVLISDGSTDATELYLQQIKEVDPNVIIHINQKESIGIAHSYNMGVKLATNEIVCILHSDMYVPKGFDETVLKYLGTKYDFITTYRCEPPLYGESMDKHLAYYGNDIESFMKNDYDKWNADLSKREGQTQARMCFPFITTKTTYWSVGGNDTLFLKYMVDDDDFYLRLVMNEVRYAQIMDTSVYHFCSRSTKFKDGVSNEGSLEWNTQYQKSTRNFIRKWGYSQGSIYNNKMDIVPIPTYNTHLICMSLTLEQLGAVEPWFRFITCNKDIYDEYVKLEQNNTLINLDSKFTTDVSNSDVLVEIENLNPEMFKVFNVLQKVIFNTKIGKHNINEFGILLTIKNKIDLSESLIVNDRLYHC
jgi:glycosyltransferase involved in cell wall biosynthesis